MKTRITKKELEAKVAELQCALDIAKSTPAVSLENVSIQGEKTNKHDVAVAIALAEAVKANAQALIRAAELIKKPNSGPMLSIWGR